MFSQLKTNRYSNSPYMKTSYHKDMKISAFDTPFRKKMAILGVILFVVFPFISSTYFLHIANLIAIACIGAIALNLTTGVAGLLSLGQAGFLCVGAFTVGIFGTHLMMPIWIVLPLAIIFGALMGMIAGLPSFRLKGLYLGISTLAMHYVIQYLASEYQFYVVSGDSIKVASPKVGPFVIEGEKTWFYFLGIMVWLTGLFIANLLRARTGRAWIATRDRDIAAKTMGIKIGYYKITAFMVGSALASMAGALYAYFTQVVSVEEYSFHMTISYLAMIIIGGLGSILGSIMGAVLITIIPHLLVYLFGLFQIPFYIKNYFYALESVTFGFLIIFFMMTEPMGLVEIWRRTRTFFELWPFRYRPLMITKR